MSSFLSSSREFPNVWRGSAPEAKALRLGNGPLSSREGVDTPGGVSVPTAVTHHLPVVLTYKAELKAGRRAKPLHLHVREPHPQENSFAWGESRAWPEPSC